jgi:LPS O-antigen subunit length determinant protein (WzzB/FepE family)
MLLIYRNISIKIINKICEKKLLIFLISFTFSLLTYLFSLTITKKYSAMFILKKPPSDLFLHYQSLEHGYNFINILENKIEQNYYNIENTIEFIDQSIEFERFKEFLKLKNITIEDYFKKNKIQFAIDKFGNYKFFFI